MKLNVHLFKMKDAEKQYEKQSPTILGDKDVKAEFDGSLSSLRCFVLLSLWEMVMGNVEEILYPMYSRWVSKCLNYVAVNIIHDL
jgi:hypothetical protein